jgi:hypothetical protein
MDIVDEPKIAQGVTILKQYSALFKHRVVMFALVYPRNLTQVGGLGWTGEPSRVGSGTETR